jgi:hypothetical protein
MHIDSQVYIYAATEILKGKILYREIFDHKGPLMYLFECTGVWLSRKNYAGVWFVQWIVWVAGTAPLFIFWAKRVGVLRSCLALLLMTNWVYRTKTIGDNLPETFASGLICFSIFLLLKLRESNSKVALYAMLAGACSMGLFLLKPNFVVLIFPGVCYLGYLFYTNKNLPKLITFYAAGAFTLLLPFMIYFALHHALGDAIFACLTFNFAYISAQHLSAWASISEVFFKPANYLFIFMLMLAAFNMLTNRQDRNIFLIFILTLLLSVLMLIGMPGRGSESVHYAIPLAPVIAAIAIFSMQKFNRMQLMIMCCIAIYFSKPLILHLISSPKKMERNDLILQQLQQQGMSGETLCVLGNHSSLYLQSGLPCNTPYFFTYPVLQHCNSCIHKKFDAAFNAHKATWIVYQTAMPADSCVTDLLQHYSLLRSTSEASLFKLK